MGVAIDGPQCTKSMCGWMKGLQLQVASEMAPGLDSQHFEMHNPAPALPMQLSVYPFFLISHPSSSLMNPSISYDLRNFPHLQKLMKPKAYDKMNSQEEGQGAALAGHGWWRHLSHCSPLIG
ncbi:hypothetical protein HPG69_016069 [Diceros bicornis minor]|uniref:Uncharacterized protein n=1 Tax=Diceros bicornis minor TaxID=77932 RepID=A0A7J7FD93_DICBM|nr:hypothetical protein HPG69_016069 [Diceros bicornis minor]